MNIQGPGLDGLESVGLVGCEVVSVYCREDFR